MVERRLGGTCPPGGPPLITEFLRRARVAVGVGLLASAAFFVLALLAVVANEERYLQVSSLVIFEAQVYLTSVRPSE